MNLYNLSDTVEAVLCYVIEIKGCDICRLKVCTETVIFRKMNYDTCWLHLCVRTTLFFFFKAVRIRDRFCIAVIILMHRFCS
jgi:hypothetical protein